MKKTYTKPEIVFENFSLSVSVAACQHEASFDGDKWTCKGYYMGESDFDGPLAVFIDGWNGCLYVPDDGEHNGICYHVPMEQLNLFGS